LGTLRLVPANQILTPLFLINGSASHEIKINLLNFLLNILVIKISILENKKYFIGPDKSNIIYFFIFFIFRKLLNACLLNLYLNIKKK
jgi:hypothetical protein